MHIWKYWYLPQQNNLSKEVIFGSNKIKEEHETMKLQIRSYAQKHLKP